MRFRAIPAKKRVRRDDRRQLAKPSSPERFRLARKAAARCVGEPNTLTTELIEESLVLIRRADKDEYAALAHLCLGWTTVGIIPNYALYPDGRPCDTVVFYKELGKSDAAKP